MIINTKDFMNAFIPYNTKEESSANSIIESIYNIL